MTAGAVHNEGADLAWYREGTGPLLLLVSGGGGDAERYAAVSARLARDFTVLRYDRRGYSRSTAAAGGAFEVAQQARDAAAVIGAHGERAHVFGNSSGAIIATELTASQPGAVTARVAHEPPLMTLLPDAGIWRKFADEVHATYRAEGVGPAMRLFSGSFVGMAGFFAMPRRPDLAQTMRNLDVFMRDEYYPVSTHVPDLDRLAAAGRPVVMAAGGASADAYYARPARLIADRLGFRYREFPGHHLSFESEPDAFAAAIRAALLAGGERVP